MRNLLQNLNDPRAMRNHLRGLFRGIALMSAVLAFVLPIYNLPGLDFNILGTAEMAYLWPFVVGICLFAFACESAIFRWTPPRRGRRRPAADGRLRFIVDVHPGDMPAAGWRPLDQGDPVPVIFLTPKAAKRYFGPDRPHGPVEPDYVDTPQFGTADGPHGPVPLFDADEHGPALVFDQATNTIRIDKPETDTK